METFRKNWNGFWQRIDSGRLDWKIFQKLINRLICLRWKRSIKWLDLSQLSLSRFSLFVKPINLIESTPIKFYFKLKFSTRLFRISNFEIFKRLCCVTMWNASFWSNFSDEKKVPRKDEPVVRINSIKHSEFFRRKKRHVRLIIVTSRF